MQRTARLILSIGIAGCATAGQTPVYSDPSASVHCEGDEYVEVANPNEGAVDVFAYFGSAAFSSTTGEFVGTARSGTTSIPLAGTRVAGKVAGFAARANDQFVSGVRFRRRCDPHGS
jgi:hypothetical protein